MGNRGDVYERYYMPAFVDRDCQAIYLGSTRQDDLIRAVGRLARHERAPTALTDVQKFEISRHPDLLKLIEKRAWYVREIKDHGYSAIKAAKNTWWYNQHKETQAAINTLKRQLSKDWLEKTIAEFHKTVHTMEVDQQLQGIRPTDILIPPSLEYELQERATVARLLFKPLDGLTEDQILNVRIELVDNLVRLCKRQETPHHYKAPRSRPKSRGRPKTHYLDDSTDAEDEDTDVSPEEVEGTCMDWDAKTLVDEEPNADSLGTTEIEEGPPTPMLYCPFCRCVDEEGGPRKRKYLFSRPDSLGRHVRVQHLENRAAGEGFDCPYRVCSAFLGNAEHFLNHTERQHGLRL
jgi:hypothetical protein